MSLHATEISAIAQPLTGNLTKDSHPPPTYNTARLTYTAAPQTVWLHHSRDESTAIVTTMQNKMPSWVLVLLVFFNRPTGSALSRVLAKSQCIANLK